MNVEDHAIDALKVWYYLALKEVVSEHQKDLSVKISALPTFKTAKAYEQAINVLVNASYLEPYKKGARVSVVQEVRFDDEMRKLHGDNYKPYW